jgi:Ser/Thr protein kinase RdoA (MazF antagonist)
VKPDPGLWGVAAPLAPMPGGHRNTVLRTMGLARDLVFKSTRRSEAAIAWLLPLLDRARRAGFTVPRPLRARNGAFVAGGWTCEPLITGRPAAPSDLPRIYAPIHRLHALACDLPQRPGFRAAADLATHDRAGDIDLGRMPPDLAATCRVAWTTLASAPRTAIHGDLCAGNLLWTPEGSPALVDWDEARVDAALFDTAHTSPAVLPPAAERALEAWEIAACWQVEPDRARRLAAGLLAAPTPEPQPGAGPRPTNP